MLPLFLVLGLGCSSPEAGDVDPQAAQAVRVVYSANGEGEMEPCGCPKNPRGGLSRRATSLERFRAEGPVVVVEGGRSLARPVTSELSEIDVRQRRLKASLIAETFARGAYDALVLGATDWALGTDFVRELVSEHGLPVLAANLTCDGESPYPGGRVFERGGVRIGVVGVTVGEVEGCEVGDPREGLERAVAELGEVDVRVGLVPVRKLLGITQLVADGPLPLDFVVDARERTPASGPDSRGHTHFLGAGSQTKSLGVLGLHFDGEGPWRLVGSADKVLGDLFTIKQNRANVQARIEASSSTVERTAYEQQRTAYDAQIEELEQLLEEAENDTSGPRFTVVQHDLDRKVGDHDEVRELIEAAKERIAMAAGTDPRRFVPRIVEDGPYAGGEACVGCHPAQHAQWSKTGHARAWQALVGVNRALDAECWSCHVTGAHKEGGPQEPSDNPGYRDVQCEACHGPGRAHVAAPEEVQPVRNPGAELCQECHDGVRDEGRFDYATYLPKVVHPSGSAAP